MHRFVITLHIYWWYYVYNAWLCVGCKCVIILWRLNIAGHTNWCTHVEELIKSIGLGEVWDEQKSLPSVNDIRLLKTQSKYELQHNYIRDWFGEIGNVDRHSILKNYAVFKTKFTQENYIDFLSIKKYQRAISRFRVSSHRLGIETGRH